MGRTIPSFRTVLEMWDTPRLYASACSNSCQLVLLHPIVILILFHHYKELKECILEVKRIEAGVSSKQVRLTVGEKAEEKQKNREKKEELPTTLDSYLAKAKRPL